MVIWMMRMLAPISTPSNGYENYHTAMYNPAMCWDWGQMARVGWISSIVFICKSVVSGA